MDKLDFLILLILNKNEAEDELSGMSVNDIYEAVEYNYKYDTLYRHLRKLVSNKVVLTGIPEGRQKTYYITEAGKEIVERMKF